MEEDYHKTSHVQIFIDDQSFYGTTVEGIKAISNTETVLSGVLGDFFEEPADEFLLLNKLHVLQGLLGKLYGLIEAVFKPIRSIDNLYDNLLQTRIKQFRVVQIVLEVSKAAQNETGNVRLKVSFAIK